MGDKFLLAILLAVDSQKYFIELLYYCSPAKTYIFFKLYLFYYKRYIIYWNMVSNHVVLVFFFYMIVSQRAETAKIIGRYINSVS